MSFMTISIPGLLQDSESIRIEREQLEKVSRLITTLDSVLPEGIRFSDWLRLEDGEIHIDLQVDQPVQQHPLALAELLATGARRVRDRYFAAFRREQALERFEDDALWLTVNAAVHAIETAGGQVRLHADKPYERHIKTVDPDFHRLARTWDDVPTQVHDALVVAVAVVPTMVRGGVHSLLLSVEHGAEPFMAVVPESVLDTLHPGRTRVSFEYVRDANDLCALLEDTFVIHPSVDVPRSVAISSGATSIPNMDG